MSEPPLRLLRQATLQHDIEATGLIADTCSRLPVPFWQRRFAARAFGAPTLPPVDRDWSGGASVRRLRLGEPLFLLQTSAALWALSPGGRHDLLEVCDALDDLDGAAGRSFIGILGVVCDPQIGHPAPLLSTPHVPGRPEPMVGVLSWLDAAAVFEDGLAFLTSRTVRAELSLAVQSLQRMHGECCPPASTPSHDAVRR